MIHVNRFHDQNQLQDVCLQVALVHVIGIFSFRMLSWCIVIYKIYTIVLSVGIPTRSHATKIHMASRDQDNGHVLAMLIQLVISQLWASDVSIIYT